MNVIIFRLVVSLDGRHCESVIVQTECARIALKSCTDIHGPQRMKPTDVDDPNCLLMPPAGQYLKLSSEICRHLLDWLGEYFVQTVMVTRGIEAWRYSLWFSGVKSQQLLNLANTFMNYTDFSDSLSVHLAASSCKIFTLSNTTIHRPKTCKTNDVPINLSCDLSGPQSTVWS